MNVGTATTAISLVQSLARQAQRSAAAVFSQGAAPQSMSIGPQGITVTGFADYSNSLTHGLWQFDLTGALQPRLARLTEMTVSDEQRKAEAKAVSQAFDLINAGRLEDARRLMTSLLEKNRTNAAAVHALGYVELTAGNYAAAEQQFLRAHAMNATAGYDLDAENARTLKGSDAAVLARARQLARTADRRDDGIRLLIELTKRDTKSAAANIALADALFAKGQPGDALLQYSTAIGRATRDELVALDERLAALETKLAKSAFVRQLRGRVAQVEGRYADALDRFTEAAALSSTPTLYDGDLARAHVGIGRLALERGLTGEALQRFETARRLASSDPGVKSALGEAHVMRAEEYARYGADEAAAGEYAQVASLLIARTGDAALRERAAAGAYAVGRRLADARAAAGLEIDAELVAFQAAYDLNPKSAAYRRKLGDTRVALGDQYSADGKLKDAAFAYERAYLLNEHDAGYRQKLIAGFTAWGDQAATALVHDDAVVAYRKAYQADVWNPASKSKLAGALHARGLDLASRNKFKEAARDFADALALDPANASYQAQYDLYRAWL